MDGYSGKRLRLATSHKPQASSFKLQASSFKQKQAGSQEFAFVVEQRARPYRLLHGRP
jgi:hypothetical protein